jgi:hypothetical protein
LSLAHTPTTYTSHCHQPPRSMFKSVTSGPPLKPQCSLRYSSRQTSPLTGLLPSAPCVSAIERKRRTVGNVAADRAVVQQQLSYVSAWPSRIFSVGCTRGLSDGRCGPRSVTFLIYRKCVLTSVITRAEPRSITRFVCHRGPASLTRTGFGFLLSRLGLLGLRSVNE